MISPAAMPMSRVRPKTILVLALSMFAGVAIGLGLGFLREIMDRVLRTSDQVERTCKRRGSFGPFEKEYHSSKSSPIPTPARCKPQWAETHFA